jgi:hypothetical protein
MSPAKAKAGERLPYLLSKLKAPRVLERLEQTATKWCTFRPLTGTDAAQPCCLSERKRIDANGCSKSTSWGSLVRAQYCP